MQEEQNMVALQQQHQVERAKQQLDHFVYQRALQSQGASQSQLLNHENMFGICQIETQLRQKRELAQTSARQTKLIQAHNSADEKHRDPATRFDVLEEQRKFDLNCAKEMKQNQELSKLKATPTISKTSKDLASKSRQRRAAAASDRSSESSGSSDGTPGYTKSTVSSRGSKTKAEEHSFKPKINKLKGTMAEKVAATRASRPWNKK